MLDFSDTLAVEIFSNTDFSSLRRKINEWLENNKVDVLDIKYQTSITDNRKVVSCLIIYKKV